MDETNPLYIHPFKNSNHPLEFFLHNTPSCLSIQVITFRHCAEIWLREKGPLMSFPTLLLTDGSGKHSLQWTFMLAVETPDNYFFFFQELHECDPKRSISGRERNWALCYSDSVLDCQYLFSLDECNCFSILRYHVVNWGWSSLQVIMYSKVVGFLLSGFKVWIDRLKYGLMEYKNSDKI